MYHVKVLDPSAQEFSDEVMREEHFDTEEEAYAYAHEIESKGLDAVVGVDKEIVSIPKSPEGRVNFILEHFTNKEISEAYVKSYDKICKNARK